MAEGLAFDYPQQTSALPDEGLSFSWPEGVPEDSKETASSKAATMSFSGLFQKDTTEQRLLDQITGGHENQLRQLAAKNADSAETLQQYDRFNKQAVNGTADTNSPEYQQILHDLDNIPNNDPNTVVERAYGENYMDELKLNASNTWMEDPMMMQPLHLREEMDLGSKFIAQNEIARKVYQETLDKTQNYTLGGTLTGKNPYPDRYLTETAASVLSGGLYGTAIRQIAARRLASPDQFNVGEGNLYEDVRQQLYSKYQNDLPGFEQHLRDIVNSTMAYDVDSGVTLAKAMVGQSFAERYGENFGTAATLTGALLPEVAGAKGYVDLMRARRAVGQLYAASNAAAGTGANAVTRTVSAQATAGNLAAAATTKFSPAVVANIIGDTQKDMLHEAVTALPSVMRQDADLARTDPGRFGQEIGNRLYEDINDAANRTVELVATANKVERVQALQVNDAAKVVVSDYIANRMPGKTVDDMILDISDPYKHPVNNETYVNHILGTVDGKYHERRSAAYRFIKEMGLEDAQVHGQGTEWYVSVPVPVDETHPTLWSFRKDLHGNPTVLPVGLDVPGGELPKKGLMGRVIVPLFSSFAPPDEALSGVMRSARKVAQYGSANIQAYIREIGKPIRDLVKARKGSVETPTIEHTLSFKTEFGSTYDYHPENQQTTRFKAPRNQPGHVVFPTINRAQQLNQRIRDLENLKTSLPTGDAKIQRVDRLLADIEDEKKGTFDTGPKLRSERTIFMKRENADQLRTTLKKTGVVADKGLNDETPGFGRVSAITPHPKTGWREHPDAANLPYTERPTPGYDPVELWGQTTRPQGIVYRQTHFGSKITEVNNVYLGSAKTQVKERFQQWLSVVKQGRSMMDPDTDERGYWFQSPGEIESQYIRQFHRLPDETEIKAYFAYKTMMAQDLLLREAVLHRNMTRLGYQQHKIRFTDSKGVVHESDWVNGKTIEALPDGNTQVLDLSRGEPKQYVMGISAPSTKKIIDDNIKNQSAKVLKLWMPESTPLKGLGEVGSEIGKTPFMYVVVKDHDTRNLPFQLIPRRGGGHFGYGYPQWLKQAKITSVSTGTKDKYGNDVWAHFYGGDTPVMPITVNAKGKALEKDLNYVREAMHAGDENLAKQRFNDAGLPDWDKHLKLYKDGYLDAKEPFYLVDDGMSIQDLPSSNLVNRYESDLTGNRFIDTKTIGSDFNKFNVEYNIERANQEMFTFSNEKGTGRNPLYESQTVDMIDPMESMNRALFRITRSMHMDDVKNSSIYHWLAEAQPYMFYRGKKVSTDNIWSSPNFYFHEGTISGSMMDTSMLRRLEGTRFMIKSFAGVPSGVDDMFMYWSRRMSDMLYNYFGESSKSVLNSPYLIPYLKDKALTAKGIVIHPILGFFNPVQFVANSMQYASILALAPKKNALATIGATLIHQLSRITGDDPEWIKWWDSIASRLMEGNSGRFGGGLLVGWKPGSWSEARRYMIDSGYHRIGSENSMTQIEYAPKITNHMGKQVLDLGMTPYKAGDRNNRFGSWYAAWMEWRDANPVGAPTDIDLQNMTDRATILAGNMDTSAKARYEKGLLSFPTQLAAFTFRTFELVFGKRLSFGQKAALVSTSMMLYGMTGTSDMLSGGLFPFGDLLRRKALEHDYDVRDNFWQTSMMEGGLSMLVASMTGNGDWKKGEFWNFGQRYGYNTLDPVRNIIYGEDSVLKLLGGPTGDFISDIYKQSTGLMHVLGGLINDKYGEYPFKAEDLIAPIRTIHSIDSGMAAWQAMNTGEWWSKNGNLVEDKLTGPEALTMFLTGLRHTDSGNVQVMRWSENVLKEWQKSLQSEAIDNFRRGFSAINNNTIQDRTQADDFFKRAKSAMVRGNFNSDMRAATMAIALKPNTSTIDLTLWNFYIKNAPQDQQKDRMDTFEKIQSYKKANQQ